MLKNQDAVATMPVSYMTIAAMCTGIQELSKRWQAQYSAGMSDREELMERYSHLASLTAQLIGAVNLYRVASGYPNACDVYVTAAQHATEQLGDLLTKKQA